MRSSLESWWPDYAKEKGQHKYFEGTYDSDELHVADHVFVALALLSETCKINTIFTGTHLENLKITTKIDKLKQKIHFASYFY